MNELKNMYTNEMRNSLKDNYKEALKDNSFKNLVKELNIPDEIAMKYTSSIEESVGELHNCSNCKGLFECKNRVEGCCYYPNLNEGKLDFTYIKCKYQKIAEEAIKNKDSNSNILKNARMKDIDITDKKRVKLIKWIKEFYDSFDKYGNFKGLYLHGSFGAGKTYLISALFNELSINKNVRTEIIYFPEVLRTLKDDWDSIGDKINYYQSVDLLLIDDIGAEKVTEWGRDEILGTILQARMNDNLTTFFTSNLDIKELEQHLSITKSGEDIVKARRIIERVKQLTTDMELISENKRK